MSTPLPRRRFAAAFLATLCALPTLQAANIDPDWTGQGDGISWNDPDNWSLGGVPNNGDGNIYHPFIYSDSLGSDLTVVTQGPLTLTGLTLDLLTTGGSVTLRLGGDMILANGAFANESGVYNGGSGPSAVTIDLNGHYFSSANLSASYHNFNSSSYRVASSHSSGTGIYRMNRLEAASNIIFDNAVTVQLRGDDPIQPYHLASATWSPDSTLHIVSHSPSRTASGTVVTLGNLIVGDVTASTAASFASGGTPEATSAITVLGDVTLNTYDGATEGAGSRFSFRRSGDKLIAGGDFTDHATDQMHYGFDNGTTGTIAFNGGTAVEQRVTIGRQNLRNHFIIGDGDAANVALGHHLSTSQSVTLRGDSRLNLNVYELNAGTALVEEGATLAMGLGGVVNVSGDLELNGFHLELLGDWSGWINGSDLVLFTYGGSLIGDINLLSLAAATGVTHDGLSISGGEIRLTNVAIPEPGSVVLLAGVALGWLLRRRSSKSQAA